MSVEKTPAEVTAAIEKLDPDDQVAVQTYITNLKATIAEFEVHKIPEKVNNDNVVDGDWEWAGDEHKNEGKRQQVHGDESLPLYGGENNDMDKAVQFKCEAADLKAAKKYSEAVEKYSMAIISAPPSALLYANRADSLFRLERYEHAILDCDEAIKLNPDSAKALRIRGKCQKEIGAWEKARQDLSASQTIDFDDVAAEDLKFVKEKVREIEQKRVQERLKEEEKMKKRVEEVKAARREREKEENSKREGESASQPSGMPGMGGMGGMPGMGGGMAGMAGMMQVLMSDPELAAGLKNPKVMAAFSELMKGPGGAMGLMSNPGKMQELMGDPDVGPFMKKIVSKLGPMMMGGAGGGGMPGMSTNTNDMDMPDIPDLGEDNNMPDVD